jgi:anti-anti-sigma regulatory factor
MGGMTSLVIASGLPVGDQAEQKGCPFQLASPSPSLVKIMRITGLDRRLVTS